VSGTISVLEAVRKHGPNIKRIVITSSCASVIDPYKGSDPGAVYSEKSWNPVCHNPYAKWAFVDGLQITREKSLAGDKADAYFGAKTWAEKEAWNFAEKNKDIRFTITTICPPYVGYAASLLFTC
jgi:nucleoside-diphosphate-sugar epimerase